MDDDFNTGGGIGTLFDLVRALNKFVDDEKLEDPGKPAPEKLDACAAASPSSANWPPRSACSASRRKRKPSGGDDLAGKLMKLLIDLRADIPQEEGLRHRRPHPQHADRDRRHTRRPPRRDGMEPEVSSK